MRLIDFIPFPIEGKLIKAKIGFEEQKAKTKNYESNVKNIEF